MNAEQVWNLVQGLSTLVALMLALKALRKDHTQSLVLAIFADEKWEKTLEKIMGDAREAAKLAATDRVQVLINPRDYMPREVQETTNKEIFRRLQQLETKVDDVPSATAKEVMLLIRERDAK